MERTKNTNKNNREERIIIFNFKQVTNLSFLEASRT